MSAAPAAPALAYLPRAKRLPGLPLTTPQRYVLAQLLADGVEPMAARAMVEAPPASELPS